MEMYIYPGKHDPIQKRIRRWYKVAQCQAKFRNEDWSISWEHYRTSWLDNDNFRLRGRLIDDVIFSRIDPEKSWTDENSGCMKRNYFFQKTSSSVQTVE
jgi:hypothetical protein